MSFRQSRIERSFPRSQLNQLGSEREDGLLRGAEPTRQLLLTRHDIHLNILLSIALSSMLWKLVDTRMIVAWLGAASVVSIVRYSISYLFEIRKPQNANLLKWSRLYSLGSGAMGIVWGALGAALFFLPTQIDLLLILLPIWSAVIFSFVAQFSAPRAFLAFSIPALMPVVAWLFNQQQSFEAILGSLQVILIWSMASGGNKVRQALARATGLGSHNVDLIHKLVAAKDDAEKATRDLANANKALANEVSERERAEDEIRASREQLRSILDNMQDPLYQTDSEGLITWISPSIEQLLGYEPHELIGTHIKNIHIQAEQWDDFVEQLTIKQGIIEHFETRLKHKCDFEVWISANAHFRYDAMRNPIGIEGSLRDITERKGTQEALFQEREKAHVTLESIGDGVITTDVTGAVDYLNPVAERVTGWNAREARGEPITKVLRLVDEKTDNSMENPAHRALKAGSAIKLTGHPRLIHRYGERYFSVEITAAPIRDSEGENIGSVLVFHDVTELRGLARKMSHQATHDALTGLINRREFERRVADVLDKSRREATEHALCYLDLDQFKVVNDTCGHAAGDELLKQLSAQLRAKLRKSDTLARLGGDEFGALLEDCPLEDATRITEVLRKVVEDFRFAWDDKSFRIGVSIGLSPVNADSGNLADLLSAADSACYIAKDSGRNRVHLLRPDDKALTERRGQMQWLNRIQEALDKNRFQLMFQPIKHVKGKETGLHGEILLRMLGDRGDIISPGAFLPSAERYHMMSKIDRWVVRNSFKALKKSSPDLGLETCSINLSGQSLSDEHFLDYIIKEIEASQINPRKLCFEITETAVIANLSNATRFISILRQMGCRFALDDFGSGLSSFAYLKNLSVDYLKLDGSFVKNMVRDNIDRAMVKAINQVGHSMNIQTIAEWVEDDATMKALGLIGIDFAQGYGVSMPRTLEAILGISSESDLDADREDDTKQATG